MALSGEVQVEFSGRNKEEEEMNLAFSYKRL